MLYVNSLFGIQNIQNIIKKSYSFLKQKKKYWLDFLLYLAMNSPGSQRDYSQPNENHPLF